MKKIIKVLLICALMLFALSVTASAETEGYYTYTVSDGKVTITAVDKSISGEIIIPETLGGYPVTKIGERAFFNCYSLANIEIPDSVTMICDAAFLGCDSLVSVEIPDNVTTIGSSVFSWCYSLKSVVIGGGVTEIGKNIFAMCNNLVCIEVSGSNSTYCSEQGILFNKSKTTIVRYPEGKRALTYVIPDTVTKIGDYAFENCCITHMEIHDNVITIGEGAFCGCNNLISVSLGKGTTTIEKSAFSGCGELQVIELNEGVELIGEGAFARCNKLTYIELPAAIDKIHRKTFAGCTSLVDIKYDGEIYYVGGNAFDNTAWYNNQPDGIVYIGNVLYKYKGAMPLNSMVVVTDGISMIAEEAFYNCTDLRGIKFSDSVVAIDDKAFYGCRNLENIEWSKNLREIGGYAFSKCSSLTNIVVPDSVTTLEISAFAYCTNLVNIKLPENISVIADYMFFNCKNLKNIVVPETVIRVEHCAFYGCAQLTEVYYKGEEKQWNDIVIEINNEDLTGAKVKFGSVAKLLYISSNSGEWDKKFESNIREYVLYIAEHVKSVDFAVFCEENDVIIYNDKELKNGEICKIDAETDETNVVLKVISKTLNNSKYTIKLEKLKKIRLDGDEIETGKTETVMLVVENAKNIQLQIINVTRKQLVEFQPNMNTETYKILYWDSLANLKPVYAPIEKEL